ncbi:amidohydrolase family protein [Enterococcus montenegrensis]|uniref:amidohydrolase family protein n=1 Tax=Enterococcus montenegrensis TaxID=3031993 RepID=UPI00249F1E54|nr:amidohydrolase family protein [Enterococcus montenegrensis]WHA08964.1 amidohydrolase family protein [Enterococcus montenegrensis]
METIIRTNLLFDGIHPVQKGHIVIEDDQITAKFFNWEYGEISNNRQLLEYDDYFVMPGLFDNHVFFSGYLRMNAGLDLSQCLDKDAALKKIKTAATKKQREPIYFHGFDLTQWSEKPTQQDLDNLNYAGAISGIDKNRSYCWLNRAAKMRYGFKETDTSAEAAEKLINELLRNEAELACVYQKYERALLSRGVVATKEIVFDNADYFKRRPQGKIQTRFYIQAVAKPLNIAQLIQYQQAEFAKNITFGGAKIMVDGVVADETGATFGNYSSEQIQPQIDYTAIYNLVKACNSQNIPCCLTTEGDKAAAKAAEILARNGKRLPKGVYNSISDLEMVTKQTAQKMADNKIVAEIYPQVLGLNDSYEKSYMENVLPQKYAERFFNYGTLKDAKVLLTSGTDLPLFMTDLPESIIRSVWRKFPHGQKRWQEKRGLDCLTLLQTFTQNAFAANGMLDCGTLCKGQKAHLAIFDQDLTTHDIMALTKAKVVATYIDGQVVYQS